MTRRPRICGEGGGDSGRRGGPNYGHVLFLWSHGAGTDLSLAMTRVQTSLVSEMRTRQWGYTTGRDCHLAEMWTLVWSLARLWIG